MRVLVCGGREYADHAHVRDVLCEIDAKTPILCIIHGGAPGADSLGQWWADGAGCRVEVYPAAWQTHGKAAGPLRNQRMVDEGKPDLVVAFPGGRGTADMVRRAEKAGIPVIAA